MGEGVAVGDAVGVGDGDGVGGVGVGDGTPVPLIAKEYVHGNTSSFGVVVGTFRFEVTTTVYEPAVKLVIICERRFDPP